MLARAGRTVVAAAIAALGAVVPSPAHASFPGTNGRIAYVSLAQNNCTDLHTVAADGTGARQLTNCPAAVSDPAWNAAGNRIAVSMSTAGSNGPAPADLYTMDPTGADVARVTNDSVQDGDPSWNLSGTTIAEDRGESNRSIATVPAIGGTPTTLVAGSPGNEAGEPQFSPNGSRIAFQQRTGPVEDLYVINNDGTGKVDLTPDDDGNNEYPSWSPDGHYLAFASDRNGVFELFVLDVSGGPSNGQIFPITHETSVPDIHPTWSPDQTMIAFTHGCADDFCSGPNGLVENGDIDVVDVRDLTHPGGRQSVVATSRPEYAPDWGVPCATSCAPPPPTTVKRTLTLTLKGRLTANGHLADATGKHPRCARHKKIKVQRRSSGTWHTLKTVRTNRYGDYSASIKNRSGTYRTRAPAVTLSTANLFCARVTSATRTHTVTHARTIPFFGLGGFSGGIFANGQLKATDRFDKCTTRRTVRIQKRSGSTWQTIAKARGKSSGTNGLANFGVNIPSRSGDYRALAPRTKLAIGDICGRAVSTTQHYPVSG